MDSDLEIVAHPDADPGVAGTAVVPPKRRAPRKPSKPDSVLADAVEFARNGVLQVAEPGQVGDHVGSYPDAERVVTHRFVAHLPGYGGWHWFATLARVPRGKEPTISEVGLLPSETSLLSPPWVPWAERVRPEDSAGQDAAGEDAPVESSAGENSSTDASSDGPNSREVSAREKPAAGETPSSDETPSDAASSDETPSSDAAPGGE